MTNKITEVHITSSFMKFLNKNDNSITKILDIVSSFKKFTPNTYLYSINNPPPRATYKYTEKLFIGCILHISFNSSSWNSFIGPIPGKQVHMGTSKIITTFVIILTCTICS